MKYDKNAILNTAQRLHSKSSSLNSIQTKLSRISPQKCSSSFYTRRSSLVRRLKNVQSEIDSLSTDIISAANKMSSDDVQNARYIRNVFNNRTSKITFGQRLFDTGNTNLKRNEVFGSLLMFSKAGMNRSTVSSLGNASSGKIPWYQQIGNFFRGGATAIGNAVNNVKDGVYNGYNYLKDGATSLGNKVGEFGKNAWNSASNFFSGAGEWIGDRWNDFKEWGNDAKDYTWKSVKKFVFGDYDGENITALSFLGNLVAGFFGVDVPLDVRDLVYDVQHWGEGDNFGVYFALDCVALFPVIGVFKNLKYADDIADGAKDLGKVLEAASDAGKVTDTVVDTVDDVTDLGKVVDAAVDAGKSADTVVDAVDDVTDIGKTADSVVDATKLGDVLWETARKRKYIFSGDVFKVVDDSGEVLNEVKNVERVSDFKYVKKSAEELAKQRKEFNTITKSNFLKKLAKENSEDLKRLGLSDDQIKGMLEGVQPKGFEVHHKFSLDDGGDNSFQNLILIDDRSHEIFTGYQNAFTKTNGFKKTNSIEIDWIYPKGSIYFPE